MPNECENWIRITGPQETLRLLKSKPFTLETWVPPPNHLNEEDKEGWIEEHWSTRWILKVRREGGEAYLEEKEDGSLEARFLSAWCPPLAFYNALAIRFPEIILEYEYSEWGMQFAGYGVAKPNGEPIHYSYDSKEELDELNALRLWHLWIWNPQFELESNILSNAVCVP
jgi:hypothetical protein